MEQVHKQSMSTMNMEEQEKSKKQFYAFLTNNSTQILSRINEHSEAGKRNNNLSIFVSWHRAFGQPDPLVQQLRDSLKKTVVVSIEK